MGFLNIFDKVRTARSLTKKSKRKLVPVRVIDIILDQNHPRYFGEDSIGTILWTFLDEYPPVNPNTGVNDFSQLPSAKPLYYNISHYPVANEIVHIVGAPSRTYNENADAINSVHIWGSDHFADESYFSTYFLQLDLVQDGKMFFEKRFPFPFIFSEHCNYIVSHQHMNALNYTYLEALYLGIPLIHNSEFIKNEAGYYYPGFALKQGVSALKNAISNHNDNLEDYKERGKQIIWRYNPDNPAVQQAYKDLL